MTATAAAIILGGEGERRTSARVSRDEVGMGRASGLGAAANEGHAKLESPREARRTGGEAPRGVALARLPLWSGERPPLLYLEYLLVGLGL